MGVNGRSRRVSRCRARKRCIRTRKSATTSLSGENRDIDQRSQQCDGVDVAAAVGSFAAGGEEVGVIVGTDATDLDVGL